MRSSMLGWKRCRVFIHSLISWRWVLPLAGQGGHHRHAKRARHGDDVLLRGVNHRADHGQVGAGEVGHRGEGGQAALIEQAEEEGLQGVLPVVPQGDLVAAQAAGGVVERAAAASWRTGRRDSSPCGC